MLIFIDSKNRNTTIYPNSNSFSVDLNGYNIEKGAKVKLVVCVIEKSNYRYYKI